MAASDGMPENVVFLRRAGMLERYFIARHWLKIDSCVMFAAQYANDDPRKTLSKKCLFPAIKRLLDTQGVFTLTIIDERSECPKLARLKSIDLNQCVQYEEDRRGSDNEALERLLEREFLISYGESPNKPLWKIIILNGTILTFIYHHVLGEGASGVISQLNILSGLNESPPDVENADIHDSGIWQLNLEELPDIVPPIEEVTDMKVSWGTLFRAISKRLLTPAAYQASVFNGNPIPAEPTYQNRVRILDFTQQSIARLVKQCREHNTSVTATMYLLSLATMSSIVAKRHPGVKKVAMSVPVSLRNYTKVPMTEICLHFSSYHTDANLITDGFSWQVAAETTKILRESLPACKEELGLLKYVKRYEKLFRRKLGAPRDGAIEVSSIVGSFRAAASDGSQPNGWQIVRGYGIQNDGSMAMRMVITGDPNTGATACITWGGGSVDDDFAEAFIQEFEAGLHDLLVNDTLVRGKL